LWLHEALLIVEAQNEKDEAEWARVRYQSAMLVNVNRDPKKRPIDPKDLFLLPSEVEKQEKEKADFANWLKEVEKRTGRKLQRYGRKQ